MLFVPNSFTKRGERNFYCDRCCTIAIVKNWVDFDNIQANHAP